LALNKRLHRVLPFLAWFEGFTFDGFRRDIIGGLTVALVLVPQSMAYAQLAGLPPHYGLYASFIPPMIAALFGSSRQLATGPVAIVSLMTATALQPLATAGSEAFIAYAILLAFIIGVFQFLLGVFRLGLVVNFLSHPVVSGFTNAGAIIIATSQLSKIFGVYVDSAEHHYMTVYNVIKSALYFTHWPTLALAALAFAIMIFLRKLNPRIPNVLVAVVATTLISWAIDFERNESISLEQVEVTEVKETVHEFNTSVGALKDASDERVKQRTELDRLTETEGEESAAVIGVKYQLDLINTRIDSLKEVVHELRQELRQFVLVGIKTGNGLRFVDKDNVPANAEVDGHNWRIKVGSSILDTGALTMTGGGAVVGNIPRGIPGIKPPRFEFNTIFNLLPTAMIISLLGFMEAISIAKAMASRTGDRIDPNQELIGQGLSNMLGSFSQSYAVSGSFSRSAVNFQAGAATGLSSVFSSMVVLITLLFLTPLLYHLPQAVLAAIIMMAVVGLISINAFVHAWKAQPADGAVGIISFICTLMFAPHLDRGIMIGVVLSLLLYLLRNMKPAIAMLSLHPDGTYRNRSRFELQQCEHIAVLRYAGSVFFANVSYLENQVLDTCRSMPKLKHVLIVGNGINELDASGEEAIAVLVSRLHEQGLGISFSGLNDSVLDVLRRTGLLAKIGEENLYRNATRAIEAIWDSAHENSTEKECPLKVIPLKRLSVADEYKTSTEITKHDKPDN